MRTFKIVMMSVFVGSLGAEEGKEVRGHVFGWPFLEAEEMQPQGGTTQGTEVVLDAGVSAGWELLQEPAASKYTKDQRAILAMAGQYRVSFDFMEMVGFREGYQPPKPYFSWATESVEVIEVRGGFVSLQHSLVMFFKDENGVESGPMVMKHWRQDWTYEDGDLHTYRGGGRWEREGRTGDEVRGKWTQAVYQVDDSPRYEVVGEWRHEGGVSIWRSESCWRPLPRREFSVRDDYQVLQGTHEITITPNGWVHFQNNEKIALSDGGEVRILGRELGVNRYERISEPSLEAAKVSWEKTGAYWAAVREVWGEVFRENESFVLKSKVEEKRLFQVHFGYAMELEGAEGEYDAEAGKKHARETILSFLELVGK